MQALGPARLCCLVGLQLLGCRMHFRQCTNNYTRMRGLRVCILWLVQGTVHQQFCRTLVTGRSFVFRFGARVIHTVQLKARGIKARLAPNRSTWIDKYTWHPALTTDP